MLNLRKNLTKFQELRKKQQLKKAIRNFPSLEQLTIYSWNFSIFRLYLQTL